MKTYFGEKTQIYLKSDKIICHFTYFLFVAGRNKFAIKPFLYNTQYFSVVGYDHAAQLYTENALLHFHCSCGYANTPYCYVTRTLSLLLNNCPTRCGLFSLLYFCRQLYMFRVLTPIIRSSYNCNYSFWYWLTAMNKIRCY